MNQERAYLYGAFLGDGFISNQGNSWYLALKVVDHDFADEFERCLRVVYPYKHVSRYMADKAVGNRRARTQVKINGKEIYMEFKENTNSKSEIPKFILDDVALWPAFLRGIMDSEGWVTVGLNKKKTMMSFNVAFAMKAPFVGKLADMFNKVGATVVSDKTKDDLRTIIFHPLDYLKSGVSFSIVRKRKRLELIAITLNDFTQRYSAIKYHGEVEDKV